MSNFLVTGASTGIGKACARWLDAKGHRVFAGVRQVGDAERLRASASTRLMPVMLDVGDESSIARALADIGAALAGAGLDGVVNNAGIVVAGPLECVPLDALRRQLEINVIGQVAVTQAFLPMVRRARGRLVFMGSIGGRIAAPFLAPYSVSKFALEAIADALRVELQPWGIRVSIVEPGSIATAIWTKPVDGGAAEDYLSAAEGGPLYSRALKAFRAAATKTAQRGISPDSVAAAVEHALTARTPKTRYLVGRDAKGRAVLKRVVSDRMLDRLITYTLGLPKSI